MDFSDDPAAPRADRQRSVRTVLRQQTEHSHDIVDAAFSRFDLADPDHYGRFLTAHARVLPAVELALIGAGLIDGPSGRRAALIADLDTLGLPLPSPEPLALPPGTGAAWGALYVVEGSRLGGAVLAMRVGVGLPVGYLSAVHEPGGWKRIVAAIEKAAAGPAWLDQAVAAANSVFAAYERAASEER